MHLVKARAKPRGKGDPWHATTASDSLTQSACARPSVEPAKPRQDQDARHAMGTAITLQCAPPRVEAKLVSSHRLERATAKIKARHGAKAKARGHPSGAKEPTAKGKTRYQPLMIGARRQASLCHPKEVGHGTSGPRRLVMASGARRLVMANGQQRLPQQSLGCRQPRPLQRHLGQEQELSPLGPARRPSAR